MRPYLATPIFRWIFVGFLFGSFYSCEPDIQPEQLLLKSVNYHGGLEAMEALEQLSFSKKTMSYDSLGTLTSELHQHFLYDFKTGQRGVKWQEGAHLWALSQHKNQWSFQKNGDSLSLSAEQKDSYESLLNGGLYVYWQPYKLYKDSSDKTYAGVVNLQGKMAHVLEIRYENSEDIWQYYFEIDTYRLLANRVLHSGRYSLITNDKIESASGFSLPTHRTSYRVTSQNEILWEQASYVYEMD